MAPSGTATNEDTSRLSDQFVGPSQTRQDAPGRELAFDNASTSVIAHYVPELPKITQTSPSIWEEVIREEAQKEGVDQDLLVSIARCESGFHPSVHNATSTASGLYQFLDSTWASQSAKYGITTQKDDPYGQIELAVKMIRDGGLSHWKASQSCWK